MSAEELEARKKKRQEAAAKRARLMEEKKKAKVEAEHKKRYGLCTISTTCKLMSVTVYSRNVCPIDKNKSWSVSTLADGAGDEGRR